MEISNIKSLIDEAGKATIVAATKYVDVDIMLELLECGINNFGENRVDDFLRKYEMLEEKDIIWHFIGNLQTNKVKKMINKIDYLHSLNSLKLALFIDKYRTKPLNCFIEVNINENTNKQGINYDNIYELLEELKKLKNINIVGLMCMTEATQTQKEKNDVFKKLFELKEKLNRQGYTNIKELSMGMSDDYNLALSNGASYIRLGRILFKKV